MSFKIKNGNNEMYLKSFVIKNFRCIKDLTLDFNDGLNILIGENNSGKTSILDALRICFSYGNQRRDIYVRKEDFHIDLKNPKSEIEDIEFHLYFKIKNQEKAGYFNDMLSVVGDHQELQLHFKYFIENRNGLEKIRYKVWGGDNEGQPITPDELDLLFFVYLGALRDAVRNLRPGRGNIIGDLYTKIETDEEKQKALANKVHNSLQTDSEWTKLISKGKDQVNEHLKNFSITDKIQKISIDFLPVEFRRIVENLIIQIPIFKDEIKSSDQQIYFELYQNGLGYNNLIYTAAILGHLQKKQEIEKEGYIALLIEEPEAHLHPQLQNIFFNYLNQLNISGFQIFISSHSPTITAKSDLDSILVLQNKKNLISSLSIKSSNLTEDNIKYLHKFLDVTKSQLFFANGAIFVEGISEALLMPVFSKLMGSDYCIEKNGIELVNINGVAFEHFANLFNSDSIEKRLISKASILTDDDRNDEEIESPRAQKAMDLEGGNLKVFLAERTFEFELFKSGNEKILIDTFAEICPRAVKNIDKGNSVDEYAQNFVDKVSSNKAKSELAHKLAIRLTKPSESQNFIIPDYIKNAIKWVVKGEI
ncbi:MAG: AAA family ATPase [Candidatus Lokiarchaeota archaeon]|nr:AAA family ATPase [Candidatus Lokiarchaeota archaeon]